MDTTVIVLLILVALLLILFWSIYRSLKEDNSTINRELERAKEELVQTKIQSEQNIAQERTKHELKYRELIVECTQVKSDLKASNERYDNKVNEFKQLQLKAQQDREQSEAHLREQFKNLATEILVQQTKEFKQTNKESIDTLLKPFKDNISDFKARVETIYSSENQQRGALQNELKNLMELNRRITAETTNLTNALKGNSKVQGDWGEMILETILDNSNLIKGVHYQTQMNIKDTEGNNVRPDVVLFLPDNKQIVIDSKTSLTAFVNYIETEDEALRRTHMLAHITSVRQHVTELGRKEYQKLLNSPDFVIMFIPNEPAFLAALQADSSIWSDAYDKKVIISSPTNLFALLKLVDDLWKRNAQSKNTEEIVKNATKLFEQLVNFSTSLEGVGQALDVARSKYDDAYKRLRTGNDNIVRVGEKLRKLGLPTKKQLSARLLENNDIESSEDEKSETM